MVARLPVRSTRVVLGRVSDGAHFVVNVVDAVNFVVNNCLSVEIYYDHL